MINSIKYKTYYFFILFILMFLLSGCSHMVVENETSREVKGFGVDVTFYPVVSFRIGLYHYVIQMNK